VGYDGGFTTELLIATSMIAVPMGIQYVFELAFAKFLDRRAYLICEWRKLIINDQYSVWPGRDPYVAS
jgi:hypothetical protein